MQRTSLAVDGSTIYFQRRYYRGDRVRYRLELARSPSGPTSRLVAFAPQLTPEGVNEG